MAFGLKIGWSDNRIPHAAGGRPDRASPTVDEILSDFLKINAKMFGGMEEILYICGVSPPKPLCDAQIGGRFI
jgi:hypothetical protein